MLDLHYLAEKSKPRKPKIRTRATKLILMIFSARLEEESSLNHAGALGY